ncbi:MAG: hypothetical protein A3G59_00525 [Candidatus Taylorbacteria bacterium RIFCSPLOWO2_12_FULL_47_20]|uniref:Uncharacterized protein n=2 Tax=Candidatus Tayloriibacteriota TaxID=1817919 RepID=A0A1G2P4H5_9BACT|nr:MAG: hypothetical protein A3H68_01920 [Candidatus Taylorbacteria bacterium RIFCSPLOWO2_02_FULL_46_40]OHA43226.1 MAG: hypothetical protein A3G59_00525 [Candidatus Taylorbacteria bacterium RIFCSPLOWO2_12_FULL_47_20]
MSESNKKPLDWYENRANEIINNPDGSVTYVFDEPPIEGEEHPTSSTTISKEDMERALKNPAHLV